MFVKAFLGPIYIPAKYPEIVRGYFGDERIFEFSKFAVKSFIILMG